MQGCAVGLCIWPMGHPPGVRWRGEGPLSATSFQPPVHGVRGLVLLLVVVVLLPLLLLVPTGKHYLD